MGSDFNFDYHVSSSRERKRASTTTARRPRRERDGRDGVAAPPRRVPSL